MLGREEFQSREIRIHVLLQLRRGQVDFLVADTIRNRIKMMRSSGHKRLVVTLCIALPACDLAAPARTQAPADTTAGAVAFELVGPNEAAFVVPVHINGRGPINFVLDTGATLTCIDVSLARELQLPEQGTMGGVAIGAMSTGQIQTVRMDTLRIGNASAYDLAACRLDLEPLRKALGVQGLVGLNFLKEFDVAIDFERRVLTLTSRE